MNSLVKDTVRDHFLRLRSLSDWNSGILFEFYSEWRPGSYSYPLYTVCSLWDTTRGRKGQRVSTGGGVTLTVGSFRREVGLKAAGFKKRSAGLWSPPITDRSSVSLCCVQGLITRFWVLRRYTKYCMMYFLCDAPADTGRFKWFIETLTAELCNSDPVWTGLKLNDEPTATCPVRACWSSAWSGFNGLKRHSMRSLCLFLTRLCVWFWWGRAHWALIGPFVYVDVCSGSRDLNFKFNFKEKMKWSVID